MNRPVVYFRASRPLLIAVCAVLLTAGPALASELAAHTEAVRFSNGDVELAGLLVLPPGSGPFAALVFTHGSGPAGRDSPRYLMEAEYLAGHGIASLLFDKRGYGESTGDWHHADFGDLAGDAVAAAQAIAGRDDIDSDRIGLRGASQSGWILPLAAHRSDVIDFLVLISPPGVTPYDQILYDVRTDLEDSAFQPAVVERALALTRSGLDWARGTLDWELHQSRLDATASNRWFELASGPPVRDHWMWAWIRPIIDFDSVPLLRNVNIPVLVILGEQDRETPSQIAGYRIEKALREAGVPHLVRYFPNGDHDLRVSPWEGAEPAPLVDGYLETLRDWALRS